MATYAVGDLQGCLLPLKTLLKQVAFSDNDSLWLAGDLVNRGPESLETLRFIKSLGQQARVVLGNHDLHLLACWHGARNVGQKDTFDDVLNAPDSEEILEWLIQQPLLHHDPSLGYTMVHAGIPAIWSLEKAQKRAAEVESVLRSRKAYRFFNAMYGNSPVRWDSSLEGMDRLRVITNYFTRMRYCTPDCALEFATTNNPVVAPKGYLPWFEVPKHKCQKDKIIFGHWAALMGETGHDNFIGLDTGCVWGGSLTMMRLDDGQMYCVECGL